MEWHKRNRCLQWGMAHNKKDKHTLIQQLVNSFIIHTNISKAVLSTKFYLVMVKLMISSKENTSSTHEFASQMQWSARSSNTDTLRRLVTWCSSRRDRWVQAVPCPLVAWLESTAVRRCRVCQRPQASVQDHQCKVGAGSTQCQDAV